MLTLASFQCQVCRNVQGIFSTSLATSFLRFHPLQWCIVFSLKAKCQWWPTALKISAWKCALIKTPRVRKPSNVSMRFRWKSGKHASSTHSTTTAIHGGGKRFKDSVSKELPSIAGDDAKEHKGSAKESISVRYSLHYSED